MPKEERLRMFPRYQWSNDITRKGTIWVSKIKAANRVANSRTRASKLRSPDRADSKVAAASRNLASRIKIGSDPQRSQV